MSPDDVAVIHALASLQNANAAIIKELKVNDPLVQPRKESFLGLATLAAFQAAEASSDAVTSFMNSHRENPQ
jgi:hypothetical protein